MVPREAEQTRQGGRCGESETTEIEREKVEEIPRVQSY